MQYHSLNLPTVCLTVCSSDYCSKLHLPTSCRHSSDPSQPQGVGVWHWLDQRRLLHTLSFAEQHLETIKLEITRHCLIFIPNLTFLEALGSIHVQGEIGSTIVRKMGVNRKMRLSFWNCSLLSGWDIVLKNRNFVFQSVIFIALACLWVALFTG